MTMEIDPSVPLMWSEFQKSNNNYAHHELPDSWYFCDTKKSADECAQLVCHKIKQASCASKFWYKQSETPMPRLHDIYIITDWDGFAKAIIKTTVVEELPYNMITAEFASKEGEGDRTLEFWRRVHWDYFTRELAPHGLKPTQDMILVCEQFETIWT